MMLQLLRGLSTMGSISFGVFAMMLLLNIHPSSMPKSQRWGFFLSILLVLAGNFATVLVLGLTQQAKYYMLLVHLPLAILFWVITKIHPIKIIFTLFTAVFLIFPANLLSHFIARFLPLSLRYLSVVGFFAALLSLLFMLDKLLKKDFQYLIQHYSTRNFSKLFCLPLIYNILIYWIGKYNYAISTPTDSLILRSLLFILTFTAYLLILDIARTDREKQTMKQEQAILSFQLKSANQQMTSLRSTQEQTVIYRHDMRHHLSLLLGFATEGNMQKIQAYLAHAVADIESLTPVRYCENDTVSLLLSAFDARAKKEDVTLSIKVTLPQELTLDDTELCAIFSNALENAITATAKVPDKKLRKVSVRAFINDDKLLISTKNAYVGQLKMDGELPRSQSSEAGHGFGIKSIVAIVEQYHGLYTFETADGVFILQLVLPLAKNRCRA